MSQAVLMSIRPEWVRKIFCDGKGVEVRKTRPHIKPPFKVYVYQTLPRWGDWNESDGLVVGEFECKNIIEYPYGTDDAYKFEQLAMMTHKMVMEYGKCRPLYGWVIWNRVVFDKPKKLSEFKRWNRTEDNSPCAHTKVLYAPCETCTACNVTRPPQSWMYVEELK